MNQIFTLDESLITIAPRANAAGVEETALIEQQFCHAASKAHEIAVERRRSDIIFIFGRRPNGNFN
jgi:hypothetical protein